MLGAEEGELLLVASDAVLEIDPVHRGVRLGKPNEQRDRRLRHAGEGQGRRLAQ